MSTYYYFYIGYIDNKTNKVHVMGPYDDKGNLKEIFCKASGSISEMYESFTLVDLEDIEDKYKEKFSELSYIDNKRYSRLYMKKIENLPNDNYIKSGYYLTKDVDEYLKNPEDNYDFDGFYEKIDPLMYAEMLKKEVMFGKPEPKKDEEGYDIEVYSASDYMYFAYPDYSGPEYESFRINMAYNMLYHDYDFKYGDRKGEDITPVALCYIC